MKLKEKSGYGIGAALLISIVLIELFLLLRYTDFLPKSFVAAVISSTIENLTNIERKDSGAQPLVVNPLLEAAAKQKAADMAERGYFAHVGPDGEEPWVWLTRSGYEYSSAGENLAVFFTDSSRVVDAWMDSPGHRANILNQKFTEIGVGTAEGTYKGWKTTFVVQFFGIPKSAHAYVPKTQDAYSMLTGAVEKTDGAYVLLGELVANPFVTVNALLGMLTLILLCMLFIPRVRHNVRLRRILIGAGSVAVILIVFHAYLLPQFIEVGTVPVHTD